MILLLNGHEVAQTFVKRLVMEGRWPQSSLVSMVNRDNLFWAFALLVLWGKYSWDAVVFLIKILKPINGTCVWASCRPVAKSALLPVCLSVHSDSIVWPLQQIHTNNEMNVLYILCWQWLWAEICIWQYASQDSLPRPKEKLPRIVQTNRMSQALRVSLRGAHIMFCNLYELTTSLLCFLHYIIDQFLNTFDNNFHLIPYNHFHSIRENIR